MAELKFLNKTRIVAEQIYNDTRTYISRVYKRSNTLFTNASPFAQILKVLTELSELLLFYIEDSTVEQNIHTAQQPESIYGLSRLAGHDPTRGFAATGEISIRLNSQSGAFTKIAGDGITIPANAELKEKAMSNVISKIRPNLATNVVINTFLRFSIIFVSFPSTACNRFLSLLVEHPVAPVE